MSIEFKMAWRNIWRNTRRSILTAAAIAFACMLLVFMLSFQFGSYATMINASVKIFTGHIQVQNPDYQDKQEVQLVVPKPEGVSVVLEAVPEVTAYTYRAQGFSLVSSADRTQGALVTGIDPERESKVSKITDQIRSGSYFSAGDREHALIGALLARNLKANIGDEITLLGQGRDGSIAASVVWIKGIFSTGIDDLDRAAIYIPLQTFQDIYSMGEAVHAIVVIANRLDAVPAIKSNLQKKIERPDGRTGPMALKVLDWDELMPGLRQSIQMDLISGIIFYFILILVVAFSILNTFLMAIFERTREFGVLMAIGTNPKRLTRVLLIESLSLTAIGILTGIAMGCVITAYFQVHGIDFTGGSEILSQWGITGRLYPKLSVLSALCGPAAVLVITFLAALWPALKVRRLRPVEAMAHV
jgi:ABC-type lipoprotein release transport system permease subunit